MDRPACKIYLRHDQRAKDIEAHDDPNVGVFAPSFVKEAISLLQPHLEGHKFEVFEATNGTHALQRFEISSTSHLSLIQLQKIARNEELNVSGLINRNLYKIGGLTNMEVILSLKDLVRQCVVIGKDVATHSGGYPSSIPRTPLGHPPPTVYICDLAGLQFQCEYNTGRLVLLQSNIGHPATGLLDDHIYFQVVGEKKKTYDEALALNDPRYLSTRGFNNSPAFFDSYAYKKFVTGDVILAGLGISEIASKHGDEVVFKFLKYGTGFFAGRYSRETGACITEGVIDGLETLFSKHTSKVEGTIKHIDLPFYVLSPQCERRLDLLKERHGVTYTASRDDALTQSTIPGRVVATTNCGDSMAVLGNEMHFASVDAAIGENIRSKGSIFCPILNAAMTENYVDL